MTDYDRNSPEPQPPVYRRNYEEPHYYEDPVYEPPQPPASRGVGKVVAILLGIVAAAALVFAIIFAFRSFGSGDDATTTPTPTTATTTSTTPTTTTTEDSGVLPSELPSEVPSEISDELGQLQRRAEEGLQELGQFFDDLQEQP